MNDLSSSMVNTWPWIYLGFWTFGLFIALAVVVPVVIDIRPFHSYFVNPGKADVRISGLKE